MKFVATKTADQLDLQALHIRLKLDCCTICRTGREKACYKKLVVDVPVPVVTPLIVDS